MNLQDTYSRENFLTFTRGFLPGFTVDVRPATATGLQVTESVTYLGESRDLDLSVFELTHASTRDARVKLAMDGFRVMKANSVFRALIVYRSEKSDDWRLSLMTATLSPNEKGKVTQTFSNPRRFSFFLGPNAKVNTPHRFLIKQDAVRDFEDLQKRFSLEVVNKEFYKGISESFTKLVGGTLGAGKNRKTYDPTLQLPSNHSKNQASMEFGVRLIGRIIFCWFLHEKKGQNDIPLMPRELLSSKAVTQDFGYYHSILEPIFFEILNKERRAREEKWTSEPFSHVPYLNGGLFSPQYEDHYDLDRGTFVSRHINTLVIPDAWLEEFFNLLESYNFTIDENTTFDEELSIDPEMLGRIFENLLAEINPETGESARKSTGSYYTPRTIVDYMVDESLLLFLKQKTSIKKDKLRALISYDLTDDEQYTFSDAEKQKIIDALEELKLLDPACGSGAFPIGALQKIVFILQRVDANAQLWFAKQLGSTTPEIRRVIEREFKHKNFDYIRKLGVIRKNIYGVDIQPIATEISRLRCYLTLIVDERIDDSLENRGIEPLPNLDFKFVTANSLIGLQDSSSTMISAFKDHEGIARLKSVREQYFNATNSERYRLQNEFSTIQKQMLDRMIQLGGKAAHDETTHRLSLWEPFSNKPSSWFDPEWMFGMRNFDVVIGNPPYVDSEGMVKAGQSDLREAIQQTYKWTRGNWDLYIAFFEAGFGFLSESGIMAYISPDKWISKSFGDEFRKNAIMHIFSILKSGRDIFESANVDSIVTLLSKKQTKSISIVEYVDDKFLERRVIEKSSLLPPFNLDHLFSENLDFLTKIERFPKKVSDFGLCENACATSDAYKLKSFIRDLGGSELKADYLRIINTGTIGKYYSKWGRKEMTYLKDKYARPIVMRADFLTAFPNSYGRKSILPKLIIKGLNRLDVCPDLEGAVIPGKTTLVVVNENVENLKFLLSLLNSKLAFFYIKEKYPASSYNQGTTFTKDMLAELPVPDLSLQEKRGVVLLVEKILAITASETFSESTQEMEAIQHIQKQIDQMVYKLYGLTPEEIKIVEGNHNG